MDLGIAVIVWMTSWVALSVNVVTGGSPMVTDFFSLSATAWILMIVVHMLWRFHKHGSFSGRPPFQARRIILAGIIGIQSGKLIIITFCLCIAPDQFWVILWLMTLAGIAMTVLMRSVFLRHAQAQLAKETVSTT